MVTIAEYKAGFAANRDAMRENVKSWRDMVQALDEIQRDHYLNDKLPEDTIAAFVQRFGEKDARFIIASLVNRSAWDGRISSDVSAWAAGVIDALDEETANAAGLYTAMHMAHLDQIARAMMEYKPEPQPAALPQFKSISVHSNSLEILEEYAPAMLDDLTDDERDFIRDMNEWDGLQYFVLDTAPKNVWHAHNYVVVITDGFNAFYSEALLDFAAETIKAAHGWLQEMIGDLAI